MFIKIRSSGELGMWRSLHGFTQLFLWYGQKVANNSTCTQTNISHFCLAWFTIQSGVMMQRRHIEYSTEKKTVLLIKLVKTFYCFICASFCSAHTLFCAVLLFWRSFVHSKHNCFINMSCALARLLISICTRFITVVN